MRINKSSVFLKLNLLYVITLVIFFGLFFSFNAISQASVNNHIKNRVLIIFQLIFTHYKDERLKDILLYNDLYLVPQQYIGEIVDNSEFLDSNKNDPVTRDIADNSIILQDEIILDNTVYMNGGKILNCNDPNAEDYNRSLCSNIQNDIASFDSKSEKCRGLNPKHLVYQSMLLEFGGLRFQLLTNPVHLPSQNLTQTNALNQAKFEQESKASADQEQQALATQNLNNIQNLATQAFEGNVDVLNYRNDIFYFMNIGTKKFLIKDLASMQKYLSLIWILFAVTLSTLLFLFYLIRKNIEPIQILQKQIKSEKRKG